MLKNKAFSRRVIPILIFGVLYNFFYSGLQNDHLNVITPYFSALGWSDLQITNPTTYAAFASVLFFLIFGSIMVKLGPVRVMVVSMLVQGLATIGVGLSEQIDNYVFYAVCLFLVRLLVIPLQMGCAMMCTNWFVKYRGRVMGIVTIGSPLFSICGIAILTFLVNRMGLKVGYTMLGGVLLLLALATLLAIKDKPERVGLYPDGADQPPIDEIEEETITIGELARDSRFWKVVVSYGLLQFIITALMSYFMVRFTGLNMDTDVVLKWLSVGAACGIVMSYVLGWVDDKVGSIKASWLLCGLYLFAIIPMAIMPEGGNGFLLFLWAFGVACMTGGCPTMHPCINAYLYGRKKFQAANRWIMTAQGVILAFAVYYMAAFSTAGKLTWAYWGLLILLAVAFITLLTMKNIPDADLENREYAKK